MVNCIICHMAILEGVDKELTCPNGHRVHHECLKDWLIHSQNCPLCNETYPSSVVVQFEDYIQHKEDEKLLALQNAMKLEERERLKKLAEKRALSKFEESINLLIEKKEYEYALSRLEYYDVGSQPSEKGRKILFLKGKINYMRGRFDLAINQLFKLVKEQYDYPEGFLYLGKAYEALGLADKAKWAYERVK